MEGLPQPIGNFQGINIYVNKNMPEFMPRDKFKLRIEVSPEFGATYDRWTIEMFGGEPMFLRLGQAKMITHPNNLKLIEVWLDET